MISRLLRYLVLTVAAVAFVFPFYWMVVTSLNDPDQLYVFPPRLLPSWQWHNYAEAWSQVPWARFYANTVLVAALTTLLVIATSALAGYAFAALGFAGKAIVFGTVLAIYMVPSEVTLVPNYITLAHLGWLDSYQAQIVPFGASVFGIFLFRQFFLTLPKDLWDAAQLDGSSHLRYLWSVALPLARPVVVTVGLFHFVASWNAFLWPLIVTSTDRYRPLQVALASFNLVDSHQPMYLAAGALMTTLPVLILFLFAQRQLVGGIAATGIHG
ncbi:MAG TPA: carbohydrate ABC transporter permease [Candidatus Dormibacteraeota bacterium]